MRSVRLLVLVIATLIAALLGAPGAFASIPVGSSADSTLVVSPTSGPVGTRVTVEGQGCTNPGAETVRLVFQNGPSGTVGAVDFGDIPVDRQGRFRTTVIIPANMDPLQGVGGGPTQPGTYGFATRPPICTAAFTVTGETPEPQMTVSPSSGPVGTRVTVEGQGCTNPGDDTVELVFQSGAGGTVGAVGLGEFPVDSQGRFRTQVTIPANMDPLMGVGGGPTRPGGYGFVTRPPICTAAFTVTARAAEPRLTVSPTSGPVGTRVTVEGQGCTNPGDETVLLVFQNGQTGTVGAVGFGEIPVDGQGRFRTQVTIPANMDPLMGVGGGPTRPGTYGFVTRPPICIAGFTVTSGALPFTGSHTPMLLVTGCGLLVAGAGLLLLARLTARLTTAP